MARHWYSGAAVSYPSGCPNRDSTGGGSCVLLNYSARPQKNEEPISACATASSLDSRTQTQVEIKRGAVDVSRKACARTLAGLNPRDRLLRSPSTGADSVAKRISSVPVVVDSENVGVAAGIIVGDRRGCTVTVWCRPCADLARWVNWIGAPSPFNKGRVVPLSIVKFLPMITSVLRSSTSAANRVSGKSICKALSDSAGVTLSRNLSHE